MNRIIRKIVTILFGDLECAKKEGLICGNNVSIIGRVNFGSEPYLITIEDNVRLSNNVMLITHDGGNYAFRYLDEYAEVNRFGKIHICSHVFVGANSIILPNVRIGENSVIGAGSIVTKSVPANSVFAGSPAKFVCGIKQYAERMKNRMPENWVPVEYHRNKKEYLLTHICDPE